MHQSDSDTFAEIWAAAAERFPIRALDNGQHHERMNQNRSSCRFELPSSDSFQFGPHSPLELAPERWRAGVELGNALAIRFRNSDAATMDGTNKMLLSPKVTMTTLGSSGE